MTRDNYLTSMNRPAVSEYDYSRLSSLARILSQGTKTSAAKTLQSRLSDALVWKDEELPEKFVRMQSTARLREVTTGEIFVYRLVFPAEADITSGCISILSPCGAAMLGRRESETFSYESPGGTVTLYIEEIVHDGT